MNEKMIRKLRLKFSLISFLALLCTLMIAAGFTFGANVYITRQNARSTLQYIIDNDGVLPDRRKTSSENTDLNYNVVRFLNEIFHGKESDENRDNPEFYYITRYFAILYEKDGSIQEVITNHIAAISDKEAEVYGGIALERKRDFGRYGDYYYQVADREDGGRIVVYLDRSELFEANSRILYIAFSFVALGIVISVIFTMFFSRWAIDPEIQNAEIQKRFITNASHELKTPLAVIKANTEMLEILEGENEWTQSNIRQVDHLTGMIQNLVSIVRSDEKYDDGALEECDISTAIQDTVDTFRVLISQEDKTLSEDIIGEVRMNARDTHIRQLCSLLLDNAIKYCDEKGNILVALHPYGKGMELIVANDYLEGAGVDYRRFFERFYRGDLSHNTDKGGYGIGLSIAESIVHRYKGSIDVNWEKGRIRFRCILKPLKKR